MKASYSARVERPSCSGPWQGRIQVIWFRDDGLIERERQPERQDDRERWYRGYDAGETIKGRQTPRGGGRRTDVYFSSRLISAVFRTATRPGRHFALRASLVRDGHSSRSATRLDAVQAIGLPRPARRRVVARFLCQDPSQQATCKRVRGHDSGRRGVPLRHFKRHPASKVGSMNDRFEMVCYFRCLGAASRATFWETSR
jgi:hypothetical protein